MAYKSKSDLKKVFAGLSSVFFTEDIIDLSTGTMTIAWEYDLPVRVDKLSVTQDDPTINHIKVIGLNADWASTSESGDFSIEFTVPSNAVEVLKLAFGEEAYKEITSATITGGDGAGTWKGDALNVDKHKVTGTMGLLNEAKDKFMIVTGLALYATPVYDDPSNEPIAFKFSGTVESDGTQNFAWLEKSSASEE